VAVPAPRPWRTKGEGPDEDARRALLALAGAPQIFLESCVGGTGADEGLARVGTGPARDFFYFRPAAEKKNR
jgi:hypothetical protein